MTEVAGEGHLVGTNGEREDSGHQLPTYDGPRVDLIGIGVQKAATTWLFSNLTDHPDVGMAIEGRPTRKEQNFFNRHYERGFRWYDDNFEAGRLNSEFSVLYFHDANVPERLHRYNPAARLVLCLREPAARAYSHHRHEFRRGRLTADRYDFWSALPANPSYLEQGLYATHLRRWLKFFPLEQIHVVLHDDVIQRPEEVITGVYAFAGVETTFRSPSLRANVNGPVKVRSELAAKALSASSSVVKTLLGPTIHEAVKGTGISDIVRRANAEVVSQVEVPPLDPEGQARLRAIFAQEVERLEALIGRDLSAWR